MIRAIIKRNIFNIMENSTPKIKGLQAFETLLKEKDFQIISHSHEAALNMEEMHKVVQPKNAPYIKNLFYKVKSGDFKGYALLFALEDTDIKKEFWKLVNMTHNKVRMAGAEDLESVLGCFQGCVNPLSLVNDTNNEVKLIIADKKIKDIEWVAFHPGDNTATIELKTADFESLLKGWNRNITYLDLEVEAVEDEKKAKPAKNGKNGGKGKAKKEEEDDEKTKLKIMYEKEKDFANWYTEVIKKGDMIEYYDISGCYVIRPHAYYIWEQIQAYLDAEFKKVGTQNCYFPMFVSKDRLEAEKDHVEGFAPEVAWVTRAGQSDLAEPIAIRPTSETIMYPVFKKWIRSHRDLPVIVNQWTNVVRWEFSNPTPFIRTREFLWQEGHTAHESCEEADTMARTILDSYEACYRDVLCIPVIKGMKSRKEKFAGGDYTYTCETLSTVNGRSIQACTSHMLGQNFAKMFKVEYQRKDMVKDLVWQTSWGFSTRSIGAFVLVHSDNKGLVLTPACADKQVMIVPIYFKDKTDLINDKSFEIKKMLNAAGVRTDLDDRENHTPGFRYNDCEIKGIPIRLEFGPKDLEKNQIVLVRRFDGVKKTVSLDGLTETIKTELDDISKCMYNTAVEKLNARRKEANNWEDFMTYLNQKNMILTPWCDEDECEDAVKTRSGIESKSDDAEGDSGLTGKAKTLCKPLNQEKTKEGEKCFHCGKDAKCYVYWGRSY